MISKVNFHIFLVEFEGYFFRLSIDTNSLALLFLAWTVLDIFLFYICFESFLLPMILISEEWHGSRLRKFRDFYMFFMYTVIGSISMLAAILYIFSTKGTTSLHVLMLLNLSLPEQKFLWLAFFSAIAIKKLQQEYLFY